MFVRTTINTRVSYPRYDLEDTSQKAKDKLKEEIHNRTLDLPRNPRRVRGLTMMEKLDNVSMNAPIFCSRFI